MQSEVHPQVVQQNGSNAGTQLDEDLQARYRFEDPTVRDVAYGVTKR